MDDIWNQAPFNVVSMTAAVNDLPFVPGAAGLRLPWEEEGVSTAVVGLELSDYEIRLINPTPRGGPGETIPKDDRSIIDLRIPHYQIDDFVNADEVQGVRAFGARSNNQLMTVQNKVDQRLSRHVPSMDFTIEFQRVGALQGIILNANGTTLMNLYTEFDVAANAVVDLNLDAASPVDGVLREKITGIVRTITDNLRGVTFVGVHCFCGNAAFDALLKYPEVRNSYAGTDMAKVLRDPYIRPNGDKIYGVFEFAGVVFENYRGTKPNGQPVIATDEFHFFPVGVAGFYRTFFAPADWEETVNTPGLPRYSKQWRSLNGKGRHLESQSNALNIVTRPKALVKATRT